MNEDEKYKTNWRDILLASRDSYTKKFTAKVVATDGYWIALNTSYFYPWLSAQPADQGFITWDGNKTHGRVVDVAVRDECIWHLVSNRDSIIMPTVGIDVTASIDWFQRYALMKAHTAAVLMAGLGKKRWGCNVKSCHISLQHVSLDFAVQHASKSDVNWLIDEANRAIQSRASVTQYWINPEEAKDRRELYRSGASIDRIGDRDARVVKIATESEVFEEHFDLGTHVNNLAELGHITLGKRTSPDQKYQDDRGVNAERIYFHTNL